jgi:hypothetical protein
MHNFSSSIIWMNQSHIMFKIHCFVKKIFANYPLCINCIQKPTFKLCFRRSIEHRFL